MSSKLVTIFGEVSYVENGLIIERELQYPQGKADSHISILVFSVINKAPAELRF